MPFTEKQKKGNSFYYYRTKTLRSDGGFIKKRVYLGKNLEGEKLKNAEHQADHKLHFFLNSLLTQEQIEHLSHLKTQQWQQQVHYEWFITQFTYDTNLIEGSTLTLQETGLILFDQHAPSRKSLREIHEAINHKKAFDYLLSYKGGLNKQFICQLQNIITQNTLRQEVEEERGKYRSIQVYIRGAQFTPPPAREVPDQMRKLLQWYKVNKVHIHPIIAAAYVHASFEGIHPFVDGNGRTGRLIINYILKQGGLPFITIPGKAKLKYYKALQAAQVYDNLRPLVRLLYSLIMSTKTIF